MGKLLKGEEPIGWNRLLGGSRIVFSQCCDKIEQLLLTGNIGYGSGVKNKIVLEHLLDEHRLADPAPAIYCNELRTSAFFDILKPF